MTALEEAIQISRQTIISIPDDHPEHGYLLHNLGANLGVKYHRTGRIDDLGEAIRTTQQAISHMPDDHQTQAKWLLNVGTYLHEYYERTGELRDLGEGIKMRRQAVQTVPEDCLERTYSLTGLGEALAERYNRTRDIKDLEESIETTEKSLNSTPQNTSTRIYSLSSLGNQSILPSVSTKKDIADINKAVELIEEALELTPDGTSDRAHRLSNLSGMLGSRHLQTKDMLDLERAIRLASEAVDTIPSDHPSRTGLLVNLAYRLRRRYLETKQRDDLSKASKCLVDAWRCSNTLPFHRVKAAASSLSLLAEQDDTDGGIQIGKETLEFLPALHTRSLDRKDQQFVMSTFAGVASELFALLLSKTDLEEALTCLEKGRAAIISQLLDDRSDLISLQSDRPELARKYQKLVDELNSPVRQTTLSLITDHSAKPPLREVAADLDICVKNIRSIPGHERFLLGQDINEIRECAKDGIIAVINITDFRSDYLLVHHKRIVTGVLDQTLEVIARYYSVKKWTSKKKSEQKSKNNEFSRYLSLLWYACVKYVVEAISDLDQQPSDGLPRVWWIGSGLASSLPFHAAGIHAKGSTENAYSNVMSSCTPSIKALAYAQDQTKRAGQAQVADDHLLIATMPTSPKASGDKRAPNNLSGVKKEAEKISEAAGDHIKITPLVQPSVEQVLKSLETCRIAHFACHGVSDSLDPSNSGLILQKDPGSGGSPAQDRLTVHRISEPRLKRAQIAYLSACLTAANEAAKLMDEVIHVVSGFQVAGFPHVVGCLWPAGDSECVEVATRFYSSILQRDEPVIHGREVASALREAVMEVRAADPSMPLNWAQFVHYGA